MIIDGAFRCSGEVNFLNHSYCSDGRICSHVIPSVMNSILLVLLMLLSLSLTTKSLINNNTGLALIGRVRSKMGAFKSRPLSGTTGVDIGTLIATNPVVVFRCVYLVCMVNNE